MKHLIKLEISPSGDTEFEIEHLVFSNVNADALRSRATSRTISITGSNPSEQRGTRRRPNLVLIEEWLDNGLFILHPRRTNDPTQPRTINRRRFVPR